MAGRVGVFASPVAGFLLRYGGDAGYWTVLVEPDPERATAVGDLAAAAEDAVRRSYPDGRADVVVTDHHRPELGPMLRDALASDARWVGVMETPGIRPRTSRPRPSWASRQPRSAGCAARSASTSAPRHPPRSPPWRA